MQKKAYSKVSVDIYFEEIKILDKLHMHITIARPYVINAMVHHSLD